jgi:uncharacterized repeat protein (TIGR01451 family)
MGCYSHRRCPRLFAALLLVAIVAGLVAGGLLAQPPSPGLNASANLPPLAGVSDQPPAIDPPGVPGADGPRGRLLAKPRAPQLAADCLDYLTNSEMTYLSAWTALDGNVYWYAGAYVSAPHSALMLDGNDQALGQSDSSPNSDSLAQAFQFPDQNTTSLTVSYQVGIADSDSYDDLYYSLFTLDAEGYLDQEAERWGPVPDAGDALWHARTGELTDAATLAALRGQSVALIFWTDTDNAAPFEVVYLDDIQLTLCSATPPTATATRTLAPTFTPTTSVGITPSPTPTLPAGELVRNGGWEQGWTAWDIEGAPALDSSTKHSGSSAVRLGGQVDSLQRAYQQLTVPASTSRLSLSLWYRLSTEETWTGYDYCCVTLWYDGDGVAWQSCADAGDGGHDWARFVHAFDAAELASLKGRTIWVEVAVQNDFSQPTTAWFDELSLITEGGSPPPTVRPTVQPTQATKPDLFPSDISADKAVVAPGGSIDYTLTIKNQGNAIAQQVVVQNTLPGQTTFASWISAGGANHAEDVISWSGDLAAGQSRTISYRANVSAGASDGTRLTNRLTVTDASGQAYPAREAITTVSAQTNYLTLILTHGERLRTLYGDAGRTQVLDNLGTVLAPHAQVRGLLVDLANENSVGNAYSAWLAGATNANANQVCDAIWQVIDGRLKSYPSIAYLVIAGNDLVIPFRRVMDGTGDERSYPYDITGNPNQIENITELALDEGYLLTDDFYVDRSPSTPQGWDHPLYLPDLPIGRLIETPAEIAGSVQAFVAQPGVNLSTGIVTAQAVGSQGQRMGNATGLAVCSALRTARLTMDCTEIATKQQPDAATINKILNSRRDVRVLFEHANHYNVGLDARDDVVPASAANLAGSLFYTVGCHAGLNVPDTDRPGTRPLDLPQVFAQKGVPYISGTGYGLGLFGGQIGLSERVMLCLSEELVKSNGTTVGQALVAAKQSYWSHYQYGDPADEKVLVQTVLYGLPMTVVNRPALSGDTNETALARSEGLPTLSQNLAAGGDLAKQRVTFYDYTLTLHESAEGDYYAFGDPSSGTLSCPGYPTQPRFFLEFALRGTQAHGVAFYSAQYADHAAFRPYIPLAVIPALNLPEAQRQQSVPFLEMGWYPALPHTFTPAMSASPATVLVAAGQFNQRSGKERLYSELEVNIYYSNADDWVAPRIQAVGFELQQSLATFAVQATDTGSGLEEVLVTYTDGQGQWQTIALKQEPGGRWTGKAPAPRGLDYLVQAVDKAGNVAVDDNQGGYYMVSGGTGDSGWQLTLPAILK